MLSLAHGWVPPVNFNIVGHELDVRYEVLVAFMDLRESHVLALGSSLLGLVLFFIRHFGDIDLASALDNSVVGAAKIPHNYLAVDASTDNDVLIVRVELDAGHLDRRLEDVVQLHDVAVFEIHNQHLSVERLAAVFTTLVELRVSDHAHRHEVKLGRVELDAGHALVR